jgi:hypothetical protein
LGGDATQERKFTAYQTECGGLKKLLWNFKENLKTAQKRETGEPRTLNTVP